MQFSKRNRDSSDDSFPEPASSGSFARADAATMAGRRVVTASKRSRQDEYVRHVKALNASLAGWFRSQVSQQTTADLSSGCQDYIDYLQQLEDRYLRHYGDVLMFGSGDCGQLALGNEEEEDLLVKYPRVVPSLRDKKVCGIACGGLHNAIFTETGQVFTWGCNDDGSLGRLGDETVPSLVEALANESVIGVSCGDGQTMAVTVNGDVWGWGCYKDKEGCKWFNPRPATANRALHEDIQRQASEPVKIIGLANVVEVACGTAHNLARTAAGQVYSWGIGECGELGRVACVLKQAKTDNPKTWKTLVYQDHVRPGLMYFDAATPLQGGVKAIGVGAYHSMVATVGLKVYSCGLNNYAQLGHQSTTAPYTETPYLQAIPAFTGLSISQLDGGMHHSLVLTSEGALWAFGRSDYCQLGNGNPKSQKAIAAGDFSVEAVKPLMPEGVKVTKIACGSNHNLVMATVGTTNAVYSWGYGDMLALGHGGDDDEAAPRKLDFAKAKIAKINVTQVAGGGQHSAIIGQV